MYSESRIILFVKQFYHHFFICRLRSKLDLKISGSSNYLQQCLHFYRSLPPLIVKLLFSYHVLPSLLKFFCSSSSRISYYLIFITLFVKLSTCPNHVRRCPLNPILLNSRASEARSLQKRL